jgi:hypothetical protein
MSYTTIYFQSLTYVQTKILRFLIMMLLQFLGLAKSMQPISTTSMYKHATSLVLTCAKHQHTINESASIHKIAKNNKDKILK